MAVQKAVAEKLAQGHRQPDLRGLRPVGDFAGGHLQPTDTTKYTGTIGLPMPSTDIAILDDDGKQLPVGQRRRDRDPRAAGDGRLLAASGRDRKGDDTRRISSAAATSA